MVRTNTPTFDDAVAIANQDFHVGLPTSKDLQPGTMLYALWQVPVTIEPPFTGEPPPGVKMLVIAESDFAVFPALPTLGFRVRLTITQTGEIRSAPPAAPARRSLFTRRRPATPTRRARRRRQP